MAAGSQRIGVNFALPLRLTVVAAVGIALEAPIFVAIILVFALVGFFGAALEAWIANPSRNQIPGRIAFRIGRAGRSATMPGDKAASRGTREAGRKSSF